MKKDYKLSLSFLSNPVSFNRQDYEKQKGPGNSDQSKFRKISLLVMYYLTDQIWWCNIKRFLSYSKAFANFCKLIHDVVNYFAITCPFESGKCGKEGKKYKNVSMKWKFFCIAFEGVSFRVNFDWGIMLYMPWTTGELWVVYKLKMQWLISIKSGCSLSSVPKITFDSQIAETNKLMQVFKKSINKHRACFSSVSYLKVNLLI